MPKKRRQFVPSDIAVQLSKAGIKQPVSPGIGGFAIDWDCCSSFARSKSRPIRPTQ